MALCVSCHNPLILILPPSPSLNSSSSSSASHATVPDDILLPCSCHFHWQCLLDIQNEAESIEHCPNCKTLIATPQGPQGTQGTQILAAIHNEGGLQNAVDIQPLLQEERYLATYPAERRARAFLEFVRENDVEACLDLIRAVEESEKYGEEDEDEDEDEEMDSQDGDGEDDDQLTLASVLMYQDPLDQERSALHIAVEMRNWEVFWLVLFLASSLEDERFPREVLDVAERAGIRRRNRVGLHDVRRLKDEKGQTAFDIVRNEGIVEVEIELLILPSI